MSEDFRQCQKKLYNVRRRRRMSEDVSQCQKCKTMSQDVRRCKTIPEDERQCQKM